MLARMTCPRCWGSKSEPLSALQCLGCDGAGTVDNGVLSDHFLLSEFVQSQFATRRCIPNDPPGAVLGNLRRLCVELLEPVRAQFGPLRITSGYRCATLDELVSGFVKRSGHSIGSAADFVPVNPDVRLEEIVNWVVDHGAELPFDQVIYEGGWVHLALDAPYGQTAHRRMALKMVPQQSGPARYVKW